MSKYRTSIGQVTSEGNWHHSWWEDEDPSIPRHYSWRMVDTETGEHIDPFTDEGFKRIARIWREERELEKQELYDECPF